MLLTPREGLGLVLLTTLVVAGPASGYEDAIGARQLLVRPRHREGRRPHTSRDAADSGRSSASTAAAVSADGGGASGGQGTGVTGESEPVTQPAVRTRAIDPSHSSGGASGDGGSSGNPKSTGQASATGGAGVGTSGAVSASGGSGAAGGNDKGASAGGVATDSSDGTASGAAAAGGQSASADGAAAIGGGQATSSGGTSATGGGTSATGGGASATGSAQAASGGGATATGSGHSASGGGNAAAAGGSGGAEPRRSYDVTTTKTYTDWDGQPSWEWDNPRTLYFEPVAGLGNRLRALASAVVVAREAGVGLKVIWREEVECGVTCGYMPPFNSTWPDLFSYPKLRLADNFPGSNYSVHIESIWLRPNMSQMYPDMPPVVPGFNCSVHEAKSYDHLKELLSTSWTHVNGEQVLCVKSDLWLTKTGENDGKFFFRLLQPSPPVKKMLEDYKLSVGWDDKHFIGVHIRRTDLAITAPDGTKQRMDTLVPLSRYVDLLRKLTSLAFMTPGIAYFVATDDAEAEKILRSSFEDGKVFTYPKTVWSRSEVAGIQQALVDVLLLSDCPVLIGTYYSSYSETAKLIGWPYYVQIGHELREGSLESKFANSDQVAQ